MAKIYSATGSAEILGFKDAVFLVNYRVLMIVAGLIELVASAYLFMGRDTRPKLLLIGALGLNFAVYRFGSWIIGAAVCPCFGTVTDKLGIGTDTVDFALKLVIGYFLAGAILMKFTSTSANSRY